MRKLSEIHGEEAMDMIALLIGIGQKITADKTMAKYFTGKVPKGMTMEEFNDSFTGAFFQTIFVKHRKDCVHMLAAVNGMTDEEYLQEADILQITADLGELVEDPTFNELFFASVQSRISGSASVNTPAQET